MRISCEYKKKSDNFCKIVAGKEIFSDICNPEKGGTVARHGAHESAQRDRAEVSEGRISSAVEHFTRNEGVPSSNLGFGSKISSVINMSENTVCNLLADGVFLNFGRKYSGRNCECVFTSRSAPSYNQQKSVSSVKSVAEKFCFSELCDDIFRRQYPNECLRIAKQIPKFVVQFRCELQHIV